MAKKGLRNSPSYKAAYKNYDNNGTWLRNKIRKLQKVVKNQPNNEMAKEALTRLLKEGATYSRNKSGDHPCKGRLSIFGFDKNKDTKRTSNSYIWHTSTNYSKWFNASAKKTTKYLNVRNTLKDADLR